MPIYAVTLYFKKQCLLFLETFIHPNPCLFLNTYFKFYIQIKVRDYFYWLNTDSRANPVKQQTWYDAAALYNSHK